MSITAEEQRLNFINIAMDQLNNLCDSLYESLVDDERSEATEIIYEINQLLVEINQTFTDEI
jgi:hypothetical protein